MTNTGNEAPLRVAYDATIDELVDCQQRLLRRSQVAAGWRKNTYLSTFIASFVTGEALLVAQGEPGLGALVPSTILAAVLSWLFGGVLYRRQVARRLRNYLKEQTGDQPHVRCEFELTPEHLWTRQSGISYTFDWTLAQEVEDAPDAVIIYFGKGIGIVRNRAFSSPAERERFLALAREFASTARRAA